MKVRIGAMPSRKAVAWVLVPCRYGCTPWALTALSTGLITNIDRNSDSPASTWFGGTPFNPKAFLVRPSTTKILVKLVISSRMDGATDSRVSNNRMLMDWLGFGDRFTPIVPAGSAGAVGALGPTGSSSGRPVMPVLAGRPVIPAVVPTPAIVPTPVGN